MLKKIKAIKRKISKDYAIYVSYIHDCWEYSKWQYNNPSIKSQNAFEAKILRQTHVIEKGMSLSKPKAKFGVKKALELLDYIDAFCAAGYKIEDSTSVQNAIGVLAAYIEFHRERGFKPEEVVCRFYKVERYAPLEKDVFGINIQNINQLYEEIHSEFPTFFTSRHSVRQFSSRPIEIADIKNAVELAMHAPSACNRQSCKVYYYNDLQKNTEIGELIAGNTGFVADVQKYLVITSDMSAYYDAFERNQTYVDGGIFALALIEALHYNGIASCILQNGEYREKNREFKQICGNIPDNEKIILFIAIGYYKDDVVFATSHRKKIGEVLIVK
ncbi:hypothetical protein F220043C3_17900 [Enterocloster asparagiformis]|uniref:nitroreductase family protein n=1 Tax=Enterocloster asparagiformis TaxID=333367 RepID=UPI0034AC6002